MSDEDNEDEDNLSDVSGILERSSSSETLSNHSNDINISDKLETRFKVNNKVYGGTYGEVWRATDILTKENVALKFIKISHKTSSSGFPNTSLREIKILQKLKNHENIINLFGVVCSNKNIKKIAMVLEFAEHDLKTLLDLGIDYTQSEVKCLLKQLLNGLSYLHSKYIIHRDIKPNNLLLKSDGTLKICDFGQSRFENKGHNNYTPQCTTLYYRAPEMLLDLKKYNVSIDNWAVGCIVCELFLKKPLFKMANSKNSNGYLNGETNLLNRMIELLGSPIDSWKDFQSIFKKSQIHIKGKNVKKYNKKNNKNNLYMLLRNINLTRNGYDFIKSFLCFDPNLRMKSKNGINHEWFKEAPLPIDQDILPTHPSTNTDTRHNVMLKRKIRSKVFI